MSEYHIHLGDCLEFMRGMSAGSIDAVVTDPPYGIGFKYNNYIDTREGYGDWIWKIIELAESKCSPGSPIFVWQAMKNVRYFSEWFPRDWRIFAACKNFIQVRPVSMQYAFDPVLVWWTPGKRYNGMGASGRDWYIGNTANTNNRGDGEAYNHPCARPLNQLKYIIENWVKPNGCCFDPFMGSGSTGVAALQFGRNFIGCEISPDYFAIAKKRIEAAHAQLLLFDEVNNGNQN